MRLPVFQIRALCFAQNNLSLELLCISSAHADLAYFTLLNCPLILQDQNHTDTMGGVRPDNTMSGTKRDAISVQNNM
jgi:hypothetical protein